MRNSAPERGFPGLDLVRFAAALSVALYHLAYFWWLPKFTATDGASLRNGLAGLEPFRWGWVGVQIFFVLSGFVIAFSAAGKSAAGFVKGRVLRLYPSAWICATITLIGARWGDPGVLADYGRSLALFPIGPWISGVYWTLAVEVAFYAAVTVLLVFRGRILSLGYGLALLSVTYWLLRAVDFATGGHGKAVFALVEETDWGNLTLLTSGCYFGLGILLWSIACEGPSRRKTAMVAACVAAALIALTGSARGRVLDEGGAMWEIVEPSLFWIAGMGCILASIRWNQRIAALLGHWSGGIKTMGLLTYPLYLVHSELGRIIMLRTQHLGAVAAMIIALCSALLLAYGALALEPLVRRVLRKGLALGDKPRSTAIADLP